VPWQTVSGPFLGTPANCRDKLWFSFNEGCYRRHISSLFSRAVKSSRIGCALASEVGLLLPKRVFNSLLGAISVSKPTHYLQQGTRCLTGATQ
jgi:hypothetical protein